MSAMRKILAKARYKQSLPRTPVRQGIVRYSEKYGVDDVTINEERLKEFAEELLTVGLTLPSWRGPEMVESDEDFWDACFVANVINFHFLHHDGGDVRRYSHMGLEGASAMWAAVKKHLDRLRLPMESPLTLQDVEDVFGGIPHSEARMKMLNATTERMNWIHLESAKAFFDQKSSWSPFSSWGIVPNLAYYFDAFHDVTKGIGFFKRAQLLVAMLYARGLLELQNLEEFTVFADYRVPQALWGLGILEYSQVLLDKLWGHKILEQGGREELEIRLATVVAGDLVVLKARELGVEDINCLTLDAYLWHRGREMRGEAPLHIVDTEAY